MKALAAFLALLVALLVSGTMDYHDAKQEHQHACEMVERGHWPAQMATDCGED